MSAKSSPSPALPSPPSFSMSTPSLPSKKATTSPTSVSPRPKPRSPPARSRPATPSGFCYSQTDMGYQLKCVFFVLRALFLSLALLLGGVAVHAQEAAVAPPSADSKPTTDAGFIDAAAERLCQMSQITGLKVGTPLNKSLEY